MDSSKHLTVLYTFDGKKRSCFAEEFKKTSTASTEAISCRQAACSLGDRPRNLGCLLVAGLYTFPISRVLIIRRVAGAVFRTLSLPVGAARVCCRCCHQQPVSDGATSLISLRCTRSAFHVAPPGDRSCDSKTISPRKLFLTSLLCSQLCISGTPPNAVFHPLHSKKRRRINLITPPARAFMKCS